MKRFFALLCVLCGIAVAQDDTTVYNLYYSTQGVHGMSGTDTKYSSSFQISDFTYNGVAIRIGTVDSAVFQVGLQRGYWDGDAWRWKAPTTIIDTFDTRTADNLNKVSNLYAATVDTDKGQALDTIGGSYWMLRTLCPLWSPKARFIFQGMTGNQSTDYSIWVTLNEQRAHPTTPASTKSSR